MAMFLVIFLFCVTSATSNVPEISFHPGFDDNGNPLSDEIVGGQSVAWSKYPYIVSLRGHSSHFCAGTIFKKNLNGIGVILTAAHCVINMSPSSVTVAIGCTATDCNDIPAAQKYSVSFITTHDNYNNGKGAWSNDIALIFLTSRISAPSEAQEISLSTSAQKHVGTDIIMLGYGQVCGSCGLAPTLQTANTKLISYDECYDDWGNDVVATQVCLLSPDGSNGYCNGDSGGPALLASGQQEFGIVSWGAQGCLTDYPTVATDVYDYSNWIEMNTLQKTSMLYGDNNNYINNNLFFLVLLALSIVAVILKILYWKKNNDLHGSMKEININEQTSLLVH